MALGWPQTTMSTAEAALPRRIGLLGDVHCELTLLRVALAHFHSQQTDCILATGDLLDGVEDAQATLELLREHNVLAVAGNHDRWSLNNEVRELPSVTPQTALNAELRDYVESLPRTRRVATLGGDLL